MFLARGVVGGEWIRGLYLSFTKSVETWGVLGVCLCCGGNLGPGSTRVVFMSV